MLDWNLVALVAILAINAVGWFVKTNDKSLDKLQTKVAELDKTVGILNSRFQALDQTINNGLAKKVTGSCEDIVRLEGRVDNLEDAKVVKT